MTLTESGAAAAESAASEGASRRRNRGGEGVVGVSTAVTRFFPKQQVPSN